MEELEAKFRVSLDGKDALTDFFSQSEKGAERLQSTMSRALSGIGGSISSFSAKAGSEMQAFAGKELGGSIGSHARGVLQLRDAITQLAVSSGHGSEIVGGLKDQIQATSVASNQLQGDVTEALQAFVEKTGDLETARKNIELYGKAATATGAAIADISRVGVELSDKLGIKDQAQAFAILAVQSKAGAIELRDLATKGPRLFAAAAAAGATGESGLREAGALAQTYAKAFGGKGSAASVTTAVENTFSSIAKKRSRLENAGISFLDANGHDRDKFEVLFDIIRKTKGDETKLREVFTQQGMRGVQVLANEFKKTGGFGTFTGFRDLNADPGLLGRDFATRNATGEAKIKKEQIDRARFYDKYLGGLAEFGAEHATAIQAATVLGSGAGWGLSMLGKITGKGGGGGLGGTLSNLTASRVYVVNWPGGGSGLGAPGEGGNGFEKALKVASAGAAGYALGTAIDQLTGGRISGGLGRGIGALSGQAGQLQSIADLGVEAHSMKLQRLQLQREGLIRDNELKGLSHGKAIYAADETMKELQNNITINIDGDGAKVEQDSGTRAPKVLVRRAASGG